MRIGRLMGDADRASIHCLTLRSFLTSKLTNRTVGVATSTHRISAQRRRRRASSWSKHRTPSTLSPEPDYDRARRDPFFRELTRSVTLGYSSNSRR
jgi:hypothetical protein